MNIENISSKFMHLLSAEYAVQSAKSFMLDETHPRRGQLGSEDVLAIQFIINHRLRLHVFAVERDGEVLFTRPKEGISEFLISELRPYDFYFKLNDHINFQHNLIARIIDTSVGFQASDYIKKTLSFFSKEASQYCDYCVGYKMVHVHRQTKTYDATFEVHIKKGGDYVPYRGTITNGEIVKVVDGDGNTILLDKIFEA